jgi:hypothetical protein
LDAVTQTERTLECVDCRRTIRDGQAKAAGWFFRSEGDDPQLVCALCATCELSLATPASDDRIEGRTP